MTLPENLTCPCTSFVVLVSFVVKKVSALARDLEEYNLEQSDEI